MCRLCVSVTNLRSLQQRPGGTANDQSIKKEVPLSKVHSYMYIYLLPSTGHYNSLCRHYSRPLILIHAAKDKKTILREFGMPRWLVSLARFWPLEPLRWLHRSWHWIDNMYCRREDDCHMQRADITLSAHALADEFLGVLHYIVNNRNINKRAIGKKVSDDDWSRSTIPFLSHAWFVDREQQIQDGRRVGGRPVQMAGGWRYSTSGSFASAYSTWHGTGTSSCWARGVLSSIDTTFHKKDYCRKMYSQCVTFFFSGGIGNAKKKDHQMC